MKYRNLITGTAALALIAAPLASAEASPWHHGGWHGGGYHGGGYRGGPGLGLIAGVAAATAALVTLPFAVAGDIVAPQPVYAAPQPVYAAPQPVYATPQPVYYGYPGYGYYPRGYVVVR